MKIWRSSGEVLWKTPFSLYHTNNTTAASQTHCSFPFLPAFSGWWWWWWLVDVVGFFLSSCLLEYYFILQNELKLNRTETRQRWERKSVWFDSLLRQFNLFWFYSLWILGRRRRLTLSLSTWKSLDQQKKNSQKKRKKKWNTPQVEKKTMEKKYFSTWNLFVFMFGCCRNIIS